MGLQSLTWSDCKEHKINATRTYAPGSERVSSSSTRRGVARSRHRPRARLFRGATLPNMVSEIQIREALEVDQDHGEGAEEVERHKVLLGVGRG